MKRAFLKESCIDISITKVVCGVNFNYSIEQYSDVYQEQVSDLILHIQQVEYNIEITKEDQPDLLNNFHLSDREGEFLVSDSGR